MLLESMKKGVSKIVIQILAVLLIASFALWGVGDMVGVISNPDEVAKVGDSKITQREFQEQFRRTLDQARQNFGDLDAEAARELGLDGLALDNLLAHRLMILQAADLGVLVGDEQIAESIRANPAFRNSLGQFDRATFQAVLANNGLSEAGYVASVRQDLQQQYLQGMVSASVVPPPQLTDTVYRFQNEQRSVELIRIERSSVKAPPTPPESELLTFLQDNPEQFMIPEYRRLTILHLDPDELAKELSPSEERIQEEYENRLDSIIVPEKRELEQILLQDEDTAHEVRVAVAAGKEFPAVATSFGSNAQYVDLGLVVQDDLPKVLGDAAFALSKGEITASIQSPLGWHILRVKEVVPGRTPPLSEVRDEIKLDLARELALDDLVRQANRIEDAQAGGATLEEAAAEVGANVIALDPINVLGMNKSGSKEARLPGDRSFFENAFAMEIAETGNLTETDVGGYYMIRVDEIIEATVPALDEVRSSVVQAWKTDQRNQKAKERAEKLLNMAMSGQPLEQIASSERLKFSRGGPSTRVPTQGSNIPPELLDQMFEAKEREPFTVPLSNGYAVARVTAVAGATVNTDTEQYKNLSQSLTDAMSDDLLGEYTQALRKDFSVVVNQRAIDAFFEARQ